MNKKYGWDDIPSLDGIGVDWDYKPESELDKRAFVRLGNKIIFKLFEVNDITIKLATARGLYDGHLVDISEGGVALSLPVLLEENLPVKVGFFLGNTKMVSKGLTRYSKKEEERYKTGIKFVDLDKDSAEYIAGLFAAMKLNRAC